MLCNKSPSDARLVYQGVIVSNNDIGISTYKPAEQPMYYGGNNHGGMVCVNEKWYIFYHRHTNGTNFSRQGMILNQLLYYQMAQFLKLK